MKYTLLGLSLLLFTSLSFAQKNDDDVLMEVNGKAITSKEFKRVYLKNLDLVQKEDQKSVDSYLDLFVDYKLKVEEAYSQSLDKSNTFQNDFAGYEAQLLRNYLFEDKVTKDLALEAYERSQYQINASHILIGCSFDAYPKDTLIAYNKIKSLRERAIAGEDFPTLVAENSEEPGASNTKGNLGFFSAFSMVYPFESAVYNTKVGEISEIIRTRFGYHIAKVNAKRPKPPKISVSHIMIANNQKDVEINSKERIEEIYQLLQAGGNFEDLAKQFSDDKNSAVKGGIINPFSKGDLRSSLFEDAAFELKTIGEISKPVESEYGWHVIKLNRVFPKESYEESKDFYEKRVKEGSRSKIVTRAVNAIIKDKFGFEMDAQVLPYFYNVVTDTILKRSWIYKPDQTTKTRQLMKIGDSTFTYHDFALYLSKKQTRLRGYSQKESLIRETLEMFEEDKIKGYFKNHLMQTNPEYASLITEYKEGLLIFEVMGKNVWRAAKEDSIGLQSYYNEHKNDYMWKDRLEGVIYVTPKQEVVEEIKQRIAKGEDPKAIKDIINKERQVNILVTEGFFEYDYKLLPENYVPKVGVSNAYEQNGNYTIIDVKKLVPPSVMEFEDAKGRVIGNYQGIFEENWIQSLREKYSVTINKKNFKKLKKELGS